MTRHQHLTDEQLYALLDGDTKLQLTDCAHCQQEFAAIRDSLQGFRAATVNLAAAQPLPAFSRQPAPAPARRSFLFTRAGWMTSGATALLAIGLSVSGLLPHHNNPAVVTPPTAIAQVDNSVSDEALLEGISQDLSTSVPPSLAPLDLPTTSTTTK